MKIIGRKGNNFGIYLGCVLLCLSCSKSINKTITKADSVKICECKAQNKKDNKKALKIFTITSIGFITLIYINSNEKQK